MTKLILPTNEMASLEECKLCEEGRKETGSIGKRAAIIYKSGKGPAIDWLITLQKSNISDLVRGFTLMLMPIGHLTAFSQVNSSNELAKNYGLTFAKAHYGMQVIRHEEWRSEYGIFGLTAVSYGKCVSEINTQENVHVKVYTLDGNANQPSQSDTEWIRKEILIGEDGDQYVKSMPVVKREIEEERYNRLTSRLVEICNNF